MVDFEKLIPGATLVTEDWKKENHENYYVALYHPIRGREIKCADKVFYVGHPFLVHTGADLEISEPVILDWIKESFIARPPDCKNPLTYKVRCNRVWELSKWLCASYGQKSFWKTIEKLFPGMRVDRATFEERLVKQVGADDYITYTWLEKTYEIDGYKFEPKSLE